MINLEWLRTFRAVYKTKSLSKASGILNISQPTVSQQILTLESHIGQKLFARKSKGVIETEEGKILNTLISGSIESLEEVESLIAKKHSSLKEIVTIGISEHLYKTMLCKHIPKLGEHIHIYFGNKQNLISKVEEGSLLYAIVPDEINTFDTICQPLFEQKLVLLATPDISLEDVRKTYKVDITKAENLLINKNWYAHDANSTYIKNYWLQVFNKKRPAIVPNYVIPNEYETLYLLAQESGLSIALDTVAAPFLKAGTLKSYSLKEVNFRKLSLISNKKKASTETATKIIEMLCNEVY